MEVATTSMQGLALHATAQAQASKSSKNNSYDSKQCHSTYHHNCVKQDPQTAKRYQEPKLP